MLTPSQRSMLEAIAHSDDPQVAPRDRLDAIKTVAYHPWTATATPWRSPALPR